MIDRNNYKEMWVWGAFSTGVKEKRIVLEIFDDESCLAVNEETEESFLNGGKFELREFYHCEEIKEEPKTASFDLRIQLTKEFETVYVTEFFSGDVKLASEISGHGVSFSSSVFDRVMVELIDKVNS